MTPIPADHEDNRLKPRFVRKKSTKPLKGFALDLGLRFNSEGVPFLEDLNSNQNVRPFTNVTDLLVTLGAEIKELHEKRFPGAASGA
jgi:hypothetical protein